MRSLVTTGAVDHNGVVDHCDECGFVYADHPPPSVSGELGALGACYASRLRVAEDDSHQRRILASRPDSDTWSPVEYGCHVRDVLIAQRERLMLALVTERPTFTSIFRDQRVDVDRYNALAPAVVAAQIDVAANMIAWSCGGLDASAWRRLCVYNFPETAERNLTWLAQHTLHEGVHHLLDIDRVIARNATAFAER